MRLIVLTRLLRKALADKDVSMTRASLDVGMGKTYLRDIINGKTQDPGIRSLLAVARLLQIPVPALIEAVEADMGEPIMKTKRGDKWRLLLESLDEQTDASLFRTAQQHVKERQTGPRRRRTD